MSPSSYGKGISGCAAVGDANGQVDKDGGGVAIAGMRACVGEKGSEGQDGPDSVWGRYSSAVGGGNAAEGSKLERQAPRRRVRRPGCAGRAYAMLGEAHSGCRRAHRGRYVLRTAYVRTGRASYAFCRSILGPPVRMYCSSISRLRSALSGLPATLT